MYIAGLVRMFSCPFTMTFVCAHDRVNRAHCWAMIWGRLPVLLKIEMINPGIIMTRI